MIDNFSLYALLGHVSDWSILYVVIVLFTSILLVVGCGWGVVSLCQRACARRPHKRQRYSLLDEGEDDAMIPRGKALFCMCACMKSIVPILLMSCLLELNMV
jgi:hypothetical protein